MCFIGNEVEMNGIVTYVMKYSYFHKYFQSAPEFGRTFHFEISQFVTPKIKDISKVYRICVESSDSIRQLYSWEVTKLCSQLDIIHEVFAGTASIVIFF